MTPKTLPWKLASPWYRQDSVRGRTGRIASGAPVIQKYASPDPVTPFMEDPQRSLRFTGDDLLHHLFPTRHVLLDGSNRGSEPLKLFQPLHARYYLVVCELYCDAPGYPAVPHNQVCEAGFVIRRSVPDVPEEARQILKPLFAEKQGLLHRAEYLATRALQETTPNDCVEGRLKAFIKDVGRQAGGRKLAKLEQRLDALQARITKVIGSPDLSLTEQGWLTEEHPDIGNWGAVDPQPQALAGEASFRLFPLTPDPSSNNHSATGSSLWYGLIPTHSGDVDGQGAARFDDRNLYQVRGFVRRHKPGCPRTQRPGDCHGELVWSLPSEGFRLASPYDLDGTSNRPVNIRLPDLATLELQAKRAGPGGGVGARFSVPPGSALMMKTDEMDLPNKLGSGRGDQVCFFAIPLITLVALFLLNIFLPILLFIFNLWFMLRLKLCIPPSIDIDADLATELSIKGPEIEAQFALDASFSLEIGGTVFTDIDAAKAALKAEIKSGGLMAPAAGLDDNTIAFLRNQVGNDVDDAVDLLLSMGTDFSPDADPAKAGTLASATDGLSWFTPVTRP